MADSGSVLILDADLAPSLCIARSLYKRGIRTILASYGRAAIAHWSRVASECLYYPNPLTEEDRYINWLRERIAEDQYSLIIPVTERTLTPLLKHRHSLDDRRIAMAPSEALRTVLDKSRTMKLAESLGIPTPKGYIVSSLDEFAAVAPGLTFPVVVKPVSSVSSSKGHGVQLTVAYAANHKQLEALVTDALRHGAALLQALFTGDGVGVELIADGGEIAYAFQHKRLHEVPLTGGGSSLRMSVALDPALLAASRKLIRALEWHGVAMVEFKHRPETGEFCLMEINGRFWGSLPLAVAAGADFPAMLYELLVGGKVGNWPAYRYPVYCRNLARDVTWHEQVLRRDAPSELVTFPTKRQVIRDLGLVLSPRHHFDVQSWRDPIPGFVDFGRIVQSYTARLTGRLGERRKLAAHRKAWLDGTVQKKLAKASNILFVCYGNINRSAAAHMYAEKVCGDRFRITSAGFHDVEGRPADPTMTDVASSYGISMLDSRSLKLTASMVSDADLIFVMELAHERRLVDEHPDASGRVLLLGGATAQAPNDCEIADPYGKDRSTYRKVLEQVMRSVDRIVALTSKAAPARQDSPKQK